MTDPTRWLISITGAYLLGSIPFGLLIGLARGVDVRQHGSKNIGATNVGRVLGRRWGFFCFGLDFLKGFVPMLLAGWWMGVLGNRDAAASESWWWLGVAAGALLGHVFPLYLKFKGGKGVATGFGAMLGAWPGMSFAALAALVVWIIAVKLWKMVSVASCLAAVMLPVSIVVLQLVGWPRPRGGDWGPSVPYLVVACLLAVLVIWKHRANLARVRAGTESRIGGRNVKPGTG